MTTIGITGYAQILPAPRTRLRLTTRGRRVLAALAATPLVAAVTIAVLSGGGALASKADGAPVGSFVSVTVSTGDSLWSIAQDVAPAADPRDVVDAIVRLNALEGANVLVGQRLAIPAEYAPAD
ncbi:LysM peptidoglycan-binding domain-containing protein [Microbacterium sp. C7(2022)]|uniref:LysM peptidoglycan-binding domain-containing protein n=1 Tax=Microbacterium sp. C7(2022) TaxID=2992759 RepID=UPI00237BC1F1|nr:LysM peptidoglycan-binding domain-containing protein [Microbacterium sp. C7(2022)]MDE0545885.1 LysM peptidoglycan-binding domain-containing protein [Microbacterium sp. C7(2022)]